MVESITNFLQNLSLDSSNDNKCYSCKNTISDIFYTCTECKDVDLCVKCFEKSKKVKNHEPTHITILLSIDQFVTKNYIKSKIPDLKSINQIYKENSFREKCNTCRFNIKGIKFHMLHLIYKQSSVFCHDCMIKESRQLITTVGILKNSVEIPDNINLLLKEKLGEGSFGAVYKVKLMNNFFACKRINFNDSILNQSNSTLNSVSANIELKALLTIHSDNVVNLFDFKINQNNLYLLLEYMNGGTLEDKIKSKKLSLRRKTDYFFQIVKGIYSLHHQGIIHKDIKSDNIFIKDELYLKIGDLGICQFVDFFDNTNSLKGFFNNRLSPPEIFKNGKVTNKVDIFMLGLVLYEIFNESTLIINKGIPKNYKKLPFFDNICKKCIEEDPEVRVDIKTIHDYLDLFDKEFWDYIKRENVKYSLSDSTNDKDKVFEIFYKDFTSKHSFDK